MTDRIRIKVVPKSERDLRKLARALMKAESIEKVRELID